MGSYSRRIRLLAVFKKKKKNPEPQPQGFQTGPTPPHTSPMGLDAVAWNDAFTALLVDAGTFLRFPDPIV